MSPIPQKIVQISSGAAHIRCYTYRALHISELLLSIQRLNVHLEASKSGFLALIVDDVTQILREMC